MRGRWAARAHWASQAARSSTARSNQTDYSARFSALPNQAYSVDTNGQNVAFASVLASPGGTLTKLGAGTLTLSGANTYSGGTNVNAGALELGSTGALPTGGTVQVNSGGTLAVPTSLYPTAALLDSVRNSPGVSFNAGSAFGVDTGTSGTAFTYGSNLSGNAGLTKLGAGAGALVLTGMSTYTGPTNVVAGTLTVPAGASVTGTSAVNVGTASSLNVSGTLGVYNNLTADAAGSAAATVFLNPGAVFTASAVVAGVSGNAVVTQQQGANFLGDEIELGENSGSNGTYVLAGTVNVDGETIGNGGSGTFTQNGAATPCATTVNWTSPPQAPAAGAPTPSPTVRSPPAARTSAFSASAPSSKMGAPTPSAGSSMSATTRAAAAPTRSTPEHSPLRVRRLEITVSSAVHSRRTAAPTPSPTTSSSPMAAPTTSTAVHCNSPG